MSKKVYHIYYNTAGNSGLYLNPIHNALKDIYEQKFFVNKYYPLDIPNFIRLFFPLTEKNENNIHKHILKFNFIRKVLRFFELKYGNNKMLNIIKKEQPDIINYSFTNMPDVLSILKKLKSVSPKSILIITCHDVLPFSSTNHISYQKVYNLADFLMVHNINSIHILRETYNIVEKKILYHPFPLIDLSILQNKVTVKTNKQPVFLFIGVMREEKGVQYLVNAWNKLGEGFPAQLIIAGFKPENVSINFKQIQSFSNVKLLVKALTDAEYFNLVSMCDYVIFPYTQVGNSGVLSTIVSLNKIPVTTQLNTFMESPYVLNELSCKPKDVDELINLISRVTFSFHNKIDEQKLYVAEALNNANRNFALMVRKAYNKCL